MIKFFKNHDEWLENRRLGIGGSDISAILGKNPYKSPLSIYMDKVGELEEHQETIRFKAGHACEPIVARLWEEDTGKKVRLYNYCIASRKDFPFCQASVDGVVLNEKNAIYEGKTASEFDDSWKSDSISDYIALQAQHYLYVLDKEVCYIAVLIGFGRFKSLVIERNDKIISIIKEACIEFWENHVEKRIPPLANELDTSLFTGLRKDIESEITLDLSTNESAKTIANQYIYFAALSKKAENNRKKYGNQIKQMLGENNSQKGVFGDNLIKWGKNGGIRINKLLQLSP